MFIHLRLHSEYSIVDSIITIDDLIAATVKANMPALALTDQNNLFAAVKFYQACETAGIKPIIGVDLCLTPTNPAITPSRLTLLCQTIEGYRQLTQLVSRTYLEGQQQGRPYLDKTWLTPENTQGLIALSGGIDGDIGQAILQQRLDVAQNLLKFWQTVFPNRFYLEVQRLNKPQEEIYIQAIKPLAIQFNLPLVATNNVRFLTADDFEAHEARVCINIGTTLGNEKRIKNYTPAQYLRTSAEMATLFQDMPEALTNSVEIAKRCNLTLTLGQVFLPQFPIPAGFTIEQFLSHQAHQGLQQRESVNAKVKEDHYQQRLQMELDVINSMGFAGYFLIVADFIQWAKQQGIPVGPGRGSGVGSLVAYALSITDIDPLPYDLLFERFLNPERVSMPDFDVDFCMDGRDRVIDYVAEKYGRKSVSQIITYGTMAAKAVLRDVGRVQELPYSFVDKIAKLIPFVLGMTLSKALAQEQELRERYQKEEEVKTLIDLALKLEGLVRNAGKHAGGVVIAPTRLTDFAPLYCEANGDNLITQFDKEDVEAVGLVKFDFLGLRTLTIIDWTCKIIAKTAKPIQIELLPLVDKAVYQTIKSGATTAIFQLESRGMKDLIKRLQPDCFEDIFALVALFRPGPLQSGMVDDFINRKHGRAKVNYPHPLVEEILKPTYGIILYQEQVMQIAQVLGGFTLGAADLLRRAMGKKKPEAMAKQRTTFIAGAKKRSVDEKIASDIFDLMEKFSGYGFNKSHSAAYALITYQTAWLKTHYPAQFMAAVLSSDMDKTDKVVNFVYETRRMGLTLLPPDVHESHYRFTVTPEGQIRFGLGALKGAGEAAISVIIKERQQNGKFNNLYDFCVRLDSRKVNRRVIESLIKSGAMDTFGQSRAVLFENLLPMMQAAEQQQSKNQADLFGDRQNTEIRLNPAADWSAWQNLQHEKFSIGFYLSGHPWQLYHAELAPMIEKDLLEVHQLSSQNLLIAGLVTQLRTLFTKRGDRMAVITLEDNVGSIDVMIFADIFNTYRNAIFKEAVLIIDGEISKDDLTNGNKMVARHIYPLAEWRKRRANRLLLTLKQTQINDLLLNQLATLLKTFNSGQCPVHFEYHNTKACAQFSSHDQWRVTIEEDLMQKLTNLLGQQQVQVCY